MHRMLAHSGQIYEKSFHGLEKIFGLMIFRVSWCGLSSPQPHHVDGRRGFGSVNVIAYHWGSGRPFRGQFCRSLENSMTFMQYWIHSRRSSHTYKTRYEQRKWRDILYIWYFYTNSTIQYAQEHDRNNKWEISAWNNSWNLHGMYLLHTEKGLTLYGRVYESVVISVVTQRAWKIFVDKYSPHHVLSFLLSCTAVMAVKGPVLNFTSLQDSLSVSTVDMSNTLISFLTIKYAPHVCAHKLQAHTVCIQIQTDVCVTWNSFHLSHKSTPPVPCESLPMNATSLSEHPRQMERQRRSVSQWICFH